MAANVSPELIASYPKVFRSELPKDPKPEDKPAWSLSGLMTQAALATPQYANMTKLALDALAERWGPLDSREIRFNENGEGYVKGEENKKPVVLRVPFRNDVRAKGYPPEIVQYVNVRKTDDPSKNIRAPELIKRDGTPLTDPRDVYPGVRCRFSYGVFTYVNKGNRGVSFGLNNFQKLGDGPRIDNAQSAADEFDKLEPEPEADLDDLTR